MTFDEHEMSQVAGTRVELYTWKRGAAVYRFAAADQDVVLSFERYTGSGSLEHGEIEQSGEASRLPLDVTMDMAHPVADLFRSTPPVDTVLLLVQEYYVGDEASIEALWMGRVTSCSWDPERNIATITHEPTYTSMKRTGLRRAYQRLCPLVWGGADCRVNREAFAFETEVTEQQGNRILVAGIVGRPADYYPGGYMVYEIADGIVERRYIKSQDGAYLTLSNFPIGLVEGQKATFYPGDDHTAETCATKFNNIPNYGGFIYMRDKNPFGGQPIY